MDFLHATVNEIFDDFHYSFHHTESTVYPCHSVLLGDVERHEPGGSKQDSDIVHVRAPAIVVDGRAPFQKSDEWSAGGSRPNVRLAGCAVSARTISAISLSISGPGPTRSRLA